MRFVVGGNQPLPLDKTVDEDAKTQTEKTRKSTKSVMTKPKKSVTVDEEELPTARANASKMKIASVRKKSRTVEDEVLIDTQERSLDTSLSKVKSEMMTPPPVCRTASIGNMSELQTMESSSSSMANHEITKTHFRTADVVCYFDPSKDLEMTFSVNLVVRTVTRTSPLFYSLLVGDQIIEVNGVIPLKVDQMFATLKAGPQKVRLTVVRPWNTNPSTENRLPAVVKRAEVTYMIVFVHKLAYKHNGFEIKFLDRKNCVVWAVNAGTRGAHAFLVGDRIIDVDSTPVATMSLADVRRRLNDKLAKDGFCSFSIARAITLSSSPNPSIWANKVPTELQMGHDAAEIAAREATKHAHVKGRYKHKPIYKERMEPTGATMTTVEEGEDGAALRAKIKKKPKKKKSSRSIAIEPRKDEEFRMPSDVEDPATLQKVTSKSGMVSFVRNYMNKWR